MPKRNLAWILVVVMIALLMWQLPQTIAGRDSLFQAFGPLIDVRSQIHKRYVDQIDDEKLVNAAVDAGIDAMMSTLQDPYALYLDEREYARFQRQSEGMFGGIGVDVWATGDGLEVLSREPNSPALAAGIRPGDIITHIDDKPANTIPLHDLVNNMLNGQPGSTVTVTVVRPSSNGDPPRRLKLVRAVIQLNPVKGWSRSRSGGWRYLLDEDYGIGYVRLTKFTPNAANRLNEEIERLLRANLRGLILDLRQNTGGLLSAACDVADGFLDDGLIVSTSGRKADGKQWFARRDGTYPDFQMAVLIDGGTASAAEIVAGAMRDNRRALVVGEHSYGKGSVQEVVRLDHSGGAIKLTTAYYYLPGGECIQRTPESEARGAWGVRPNLPVNMTDEQRRRWFAVWREIGREPVPGASSRPSTMPEIDDPVDLKTSARRLLDVDIQLKKAVEYLQRRISPEKLRNDTSPVH
jgi:carboxyl-terminal processing protease